MVLLIDTATLPPGERDDALSAVLSNASGPMRVWHDSPDQLIRNKTHLWNIGPRNVLIRSQDYNVRFNRSLTDVRADDREFFAVTFQHSGSSRSSQLSGELSEQRPGALSLHNVASAHEFAFEGHAENASFLISHDDLDLPYSLVAEAAPHLSTSPLYPLVTADIARLGEVAESLSDSPEPAELLALATVQLVKALIASTNSENRRSKQALHESLLETTTAFARAHLGEDSLNAERIAAANNITERHLLRLWAEAGHDLNDWIRAARRDAATPGPRVTDF